MSDEGPPEKALGILTEWRWRELRVREIILASNRYAIEGFLHPKNQGLVGGWMAEGSRHLQWILDRTAAGSDGPDAAPQKEVARSEAEPGGAFRAGPYSGEWGKSYGLPGWWWKVEGPGFEAEGMAPEESTAVACAEAVARVRGGSISDE